MSIPRLHMSDIRKSFGATKALTSVSLQLGAGEALALIGENGAGKSTLMKTLSGVHQPDGGAMILDGKAYQPESPQDARNRGIIMVYQELTLAPDLTVAENIMLGVEPTNALGMVDRKKRDTQAAEALERLGRSDLKLTQQVSELSVGQQQMVEIARAMVTSPRVLVLDEPTSSLTRNDVEHLFGVIKRLKEQGVSIIYISHFLEECQEVADHYTILRDGESVAHGAMADISQADLIRHMVGRDVSNLYPRSTRQRGDCLLTVTNLVGTTQPQNLSLQVHAGQVIGIFGLIGSGRSESLRCLFGLDHYQSGYIYYRDTQLVHPSTSSWWQRGVGMVSENRKEEGLMLNRSLADNLAMSKLQAYTKIGLIDHRAQAESCATWIDTLAVRCQGPQQAIGALSGGNQQKIAIGRLLHHDCDLLLLDEPTRGIDVGSKARIYQLIDEEACKGKAVIVVSSYIPELLGLCDDITVMCRGQLSSTKPVHEWDEHSMMAAAIGHDT